MPHRVLIIEDDRNLRAFLQKAFREEGYEVAEAASGDDGLTEIEAFKPDCVVLDRMLPGIDGMAVLDRIRSGGGALPILMLTAMGEMEERVKGLEAGADDYLPKPFDLPELLARVQALIRRAALAPDNNLLQVGGLRMDRAARSVSVAGVTVEFTQREFGLLEFMMRNVGRTLSRTRIAEAVWDYQFDSSTNVVDVYINYLRQKLSTLNDGTEIVTIRGVGYRLEGP